MSQLRLILTAGFAMFSMYFGSGNIIYPLIVGRTVEDASLYGIIGWVFTAVMIPLMGLISIIGSGGDRHNYFMNLGRPITFVIIALIMVLVGPFGVIPRCITVSHGAFKVLFENVELWQFSAVFCALLLAISWNPGKVVDIIGKVITPFKLGGILLIMVLCLIASPTETVGHSDALESMIFGMKQGYQTMDLIGSFLFGATIFSYFVHHFKSDEAKVKNYAYKASIISGITLAVVYSGFILLGARYASLFPDIGHEYFLAHITQYALGDAVALPFLSFTVTISCIATGSILMTLWTEFLYEDIVRKKIPEKICLIFSTVLSFGVSLVGFGYINNILGRVLDWVYPLFILYALFKLFKPTCAQKWH